MELWGILWGIILFCVVATGTITYACYRKTFYAPPRKPRDPDVFDLPEGAIYEPFRDIMTQYILQTRTLPFEQFEIRSFDGLRLTAKYYEYAPGAPMELMFHGYRGNAERDLSGGVLRCFQVGRNALVVDQRCCGDSDGNTITFGINEHRDCLSWVDFAVKHFGPDVKIMLTGISMGASTVLMAAGKPLPKNVIGVLADCGFSSPKAIIQTVIRQMGLPPQVGYPFVKLGARLFGGFDLEEYSPMEAFKTCKLPVIFYHGENDDFVPCDMSREMFAAYNGKKELVVIPNAGHGLSYPVDPPHYLQTLRDFFGPEASAQETNQ